MSLYMSTCPDGASLQPVADRPLEDTHTEQLTQHVRAEYKPPSAHGHMRLSGLKKQGSNMELTYHSHLHFLIFTETLTYPKAMGLALVPSWDM